MSRTYRLKGEPSTSEDDLHKQVADALAILLLPPAEFTSFPAGGYYLSPAARARLIRIGVKTGWPDLLVQWGGRCHGIELKTATGRLSTSHVVRTRRGGLRLVVGQAEMHQRLTAAGMRIAVCRSLPDVLAVLRGWGIPLRLREHIGRSQGATAA